LNYLFALFVLFVCLRKLKIKETRKESRETHQQGKEKAKRSGSAFSGCLIVVICFSLIACLL